jgi:spore coat protein U-like protein
MVKLQTTTHPFKLLVTLALLVLGILPSSALAATKAASSQTSLSVLTECTISATDLDLGIYNFRTGASGTAHTKVSCNTPDAVVDVQNNDAFIGANSVTNSVTFARTLTGASDTIPYQFEIAHPFPVFGLGFGQTEWGGIVGGTALGWACTDCVFHNSDFVLTGTVAPGLWKPAGLYSEIVTITLTYNLI